jgi:hypothetical protein
METPQPPPRCSRAGLRRGGRRWPVGQWPGDPDGLLRKGAEPAPPPPLASPAAPMPEGLAGEARGGRYTQGGAVPRARAGHPRGQPRSPNSFAFAPHGAQFVCPASRRSRQLVRLPAAAPPITLPRTRQRPAVRARGACGHSPAPFSHCVGSFAGCCQFEQTRRGAVAVQVAA